MCGRTAHRQSSSSSYGGSAAGPSHSAPVSNDEVSTRQDAVHTATNRKLGCISFSYAFSRHKSGLVPFRSSPQFTQVMTLHDCFTILSTMVSLPPTGISGGLTSWILWGLWTARNLLIFENRAPPAKLVVVKALISAREWLQAQSSSLMRPGRLLQETEFPPCPPDVVTLQLRCSVVCLE